MCVDQCPQGYGLIGNRRFVEQAGLLLWQFIHPPCRLFLCGEGFFHWVEILFRSTASFGAGSGKLKLKQRAILRPRNAYLVAPLFRRGSRLENQPFTTRSLQPLAVRLASKLLRRESATTPTAVQIVRQ